MTKNSTLMASSEALRMAMGREAKEFQRRREVARMVLGTTRIGNIETARPNRTARPTDQAPDPRSSEVIEYRGEYYRVAISDREPCARCGVRRDAHEHHGCKRWRMGQ